LCVGKIAEKKVCQCFLEMVVCFLFFGVFLWFFGICGVLNGPPPSAGIGLTAKRVPGQHHLSKKNLVIGNLSCKTRCQALTRPGPVAQRILRRILYFQNGWHVMIQWVTFIPAGQAVFNFNTAGIACAGQGMSRPGEKCSSACCCFIWVGIFVLEYQCFLMNCQLTSVFCQHC